MANKTLYVRDSDLALWDLAQIQLGQSISAVFAEFLRERVKLMNVFVHVIRTAPNSQELVVMFLPTEPSGSGAGSPHYIQESQLVTFLQENGVASSVVKKIASDLHNAQNVSELTTVVRRNPVMFTTFQASTQYGDWKGTASADEYGAHRSFIELFEATGKVDHEEEVMIGFEFYHDEEPFYCAGFFHRKPDENDHGWGPALNTKFQKDQSAPIKVKKVRVEITRDEFFKHFKRFNVVLVNSAMDIVGRGYEIVEGDD